jgi:hypothetical protein
MLDVHRSDANRLLVRAYAGACAEALAFFIGDAKFRMAHVASLTQIVPSRESGCGSSGPLSISLANEREVVRTVDYKAVKILISRGCNALAIERLHPARAVPTKKRTVSPLSTRISRHLTVKPAHAAPRIFGWQSAPE